MDLEFHHEAEIPGHLVRGRGAGRAHAEDYEKGVLGMDVMGEIRQFVKSQADLSAFNKAWLESGQKIGFLEFLKINYIPLPRSAKYRIIQLFGGN